ncbi:MAG: PIN domain-containing protein [Myxococcales bacterium]|nr:PIN domain-containing protein [Myxococcales bacterium]
MPTGDDTALVESALADHQACLPPVVLTELLSDPSLPKNVASLLSQLPLLDSHPGFWERAAKLRAKLISQRHRARLADTLIAQSCLDHDIRLVTRDDDFRHFARIGRLRLAL